MEPLLQHARPQNNYTKSRSVQNSVSKFDCFCCFAFKQNTTGVTHYFSVSLVTNAQGHSKGTSTRAHVQCCYADADDDGDGDDRTTTCLAAS